MVDLNHNYDDANERKPLEAALRGSLPCINCSYELQGLSIRGNCPECGLAVRATILHRVDPDADAFHPLPTPRLTAFGVVVMCWGALIAVLMAWVPRLADISAEIRGSVAAPQVGWAAWVSMAGLGLSAAGATGLIRPTQETTRRQMRLAIVGVIAYAPLIWCWARIHFVVDAGGRAAPYFDMAPNPERIGLRLGVGLSALVILLALRPNARQLVARSLVLRTGRVDRQTIYATAAAVGLTMLGDCLRLIASQMPAANRPLVAGAGAIVILLGSLLVTLALAGAAIDGWRIRRSLVTPSSTLGQLIEFRRDNAA